ncbi:MAG: hypothetical protein JJT82_03625 [Legionellaceae bacterium]|nr:hypothetical protein [Legionellaceae bacterium]
MAYTLTLLGTDTQFTPNQLANAYDRAETLSYLSTLIHPQSTMQTDAVTQFRNAHVCVINGPTTLGSEVYDRISRGVAAVLEAVSRGETNVSVIAHSRGAVEAILVAHELERIQNVFNEKGDAALEEVVNSSCQSTRAMMNIGHKSEYQSLDLKNISQNIAGLKLSMLNIDPVPGGNYVGITRVSSLAWRDSRFYEVPKIVQEYEQFVYENERTRCFKPIVPKCASPETKFKLSSLPGHHGTGSGNLLDQQRKNTKSDKSTEHVQELVIAKLVDFLNRNGIELTPRQEPDSDPFVELTNRLLRDKEPSLEVRLKEIYFQLYNKILVNKDAYNSYNQTSYAVLGQEQALARLVFKVLDQRIVHYQTHNDTYLHTIIPPVPGDHFLNFEHARMHLNKQLGLSDTNTLSETLDTARKRLIKICENTSRLEELKSTEERMSQSLQEDTIAHICLKSKEAFDLLLEGVSTLIEQVRQPYLQNKLVDPRERAKIYDAIQSMFEVFSKFDRNNQLATTIYAQLRTDLKHTLNIKHDNLKHQYLALSNKLKEKQFLHELEKNIRTIAENVRDNEPLKNQLYKLESKLVSIGKQQPLSSTIRTSLAEEFTVLNDMKLSSDSAEESRSLACLLLHEAIEENFTYLFPQIIEEVIALSHALENFKTSLPDFKALDNALNYTQYQLELEQYRAHVIELAAKYIHRNTIPLDNVKALFSIEDEGIYKQIEGIAIALGAIHPLSLTIDEKQQIIEELSTTIKDQATHINLLTSTLQEQAELIRQLQSDKNEQMQLVQKLTSTNQTQERLIAQLRADNNQLEDDNTALRTKVTELNKALEDIHKSQDLTATIDEEAELNLQIIIRDKLNPLTKNYLTHLANEVKKSVDSTLDTSDLSNLVDHVKQIENWPNDAASKALKQKFDAVSALFNILEERNKPSVKVSKFFNTLNETDQVIQAHRTPAWRQYVMKALFVLATGILPGLAILAYSAITSNTPKIFQSSGMTFFKSCQEEAKDSWTEAQTLHSIPELNEV